MVTGQQRPPRSRLATAGAEAAVESVFGKQSEGAKAGNIVFQAVMLLALAIAMAMLTSLLIYSLIKGWPRLDMNMITENPTSRSSKVDEAGFRPALLGTLYIILGVIVLVVPVGVGAAVYLEEYSNRDRWYNRIIELNIQNLAGIPSIVFGILGLAFIVRARDGIGLGLGAVAAAASVTLALLVLPTVIIASREAIRAVPPSIREGSLALGATQWQTISRQVLPAAVPGILTGIILAISRAIGEAAPLLLIGAATFVTFDPVLFDGGYSALPVQIFNYAKESREEFQTLAFAGIILMLVVLLTMNSFAIWLRNRYERRW